MSLWNLENLDPEPNPPSPSEAAAYKRIYARALAGGEFIAQVGRRMPKSGFSGSYTGPFDLRQLFLKEEDDWEVQVAGVGTMIGATTSAVVDTRRSSTTNVPAVFGMSGCGPQQLGAVNTAVGLKALVAAAVRRSWYNVEYAANLYAISTLDEIWYQWDKESGACPDDRPGATIRNLFGLYVDVLHPGDTTASRKTTIPRAIGVVIHNTQPELLANADPLASFGAQNCADFAPSCGTANAAKPHKERGASIVTRSQIVFGDNKSDQTITGWNTDAVHLEGVLRLRGRSQKPEFDCCVPAAERVGVLYYDNVANTLRISIPGPSNSIIWKKVLLDAESATTSSCGGRAGHAPESQEDFELDYSAAMDDGTSPYIPPEVEALPVFTPPKGGSLRVTVLVSGFMGEKPSFHYSRVGSAGSLSPDVPWTPIPDEYVEPVRGLDPGDDAFTITYPFDQAGASGRGPRPGDSIRIIAQSPTDGRTAGTTVLYPTVEEVEE